MKIVLIFVLSIFASSQSASIPELEVPFHESLNDGAQLDNRIYDGYEAQINQFPYQVSLRMPNHDRPTFTTCGGSLISSRWVLTAAHCTENRTQFNLRFGSVHRREGGVTTTSFLTIIHPQYNRSHSLNYDLALIHIPTTLNFNAAIRPVNLPRMSQANSTFAGRLAIVSGWGALDAESSVVNELRYVHTKIITNDECRKNYNARTVVDHVVCSLGYLKPSQGSCSGDSGGPLVLDGNTQIGIVSFGASTSRGGCAAGLGSGYIRTASFLQWIGQSTGILIQK